MTLQTVWPLAVAALLSVAVVVLAILLARQAPRGREEADRGLGEVREVLSGRDEAIQSQVSRIDSRLASLGDAIARGEAALEEQVRGIGARVAEVTGLFTNDRARGGWGEISMLRIFEMGGLVEGRDYTAHFRAGDRAPDAVVHLPGGRDIVVDAKFPVARYNEALAAEDPAERERLLADQGKELVRVGKALIDRGYADLASGGYLVMYLPSQAVYEAAARAHPEAIERLLERRVVVAGPATLYSLLMNVASLVTEHRALQQADEILDEARELQRRITVFVGHLHAVGSGLARTLDSFNGAVGSWTSRVAPQLTRVAELSGGDEQTPPQPVDGAVRELRVVG